MAGLVAPAPLITAYTISLASPAAMAAAAERAAWRPLLKVKLGGGDDDGKRIAAVRRAAPRAELIVDANEGWNADNFAAKLRRLRRCRRHADRAAAARRAATRRWRASSAPIPVCADESVHDRASLDALAGKYDAVNIKLDKAGGLDRSAGARR